MQEQDMAKHIVAVLKRGDHRLDQATLDRLASARRQAMAALPASAAEIKLAGVGKELATFLHEHRIWPALLAGAMLVMFILMQSAGNREPVGADSLLLAAELPPEAFLDKGFDTWLEQSAQP